jgi:hypothetical protein
VPASPGPLEQEEEEERFDKRVKYMNSSVYCVIY